MSEADEPTRVCWRCGESFAMRRNIQHGRECTKQGHGADLVVVAREVAACGRAHEAMVRLIGNVRADELERLGIAYEGLTAERDALRARVAELEAELEAERKKHSQRADVAQAQLGELKDALGDVCWAPHKAALAKARGLRARIAELEAARPQWTTQAPTVPGEYWWRDTVSGAKRTVTLFANGMTLYVHDRLRPDDLPLSKVHDDECEWAGPLVAP